jgi:hypothetical protein
VHSRRCCCVLMQTLPSAAQGALTRHINYIMQDNLFRFYSIYNAQALLRVQRKSCGKINSIYIKKWEQVYSLSFESSLPKDIL